MRGPQTTGPRQFDDRIWESGGLSSRRQIVINDLIGGIIHRKPGTIHEGAHLPSNRFPDMRIDPYAMLTQGSFDASFGCENATNFVFTLVASFLFRST